ncbi:recombinase RecT [Pirellulaceae bacterium SH449]
MSTVEEPKKAELQKPSPALRFRMQATNLAAGMLKEWVGEARAAEATGRIAVALSASAAASKKPEEFYACTPASVAKVIAISALTGIMPSTGATALAYAIPRRPRSDEAPQLQYQLSHRGVNALANRAKMHMVTIPISYSDTLETQESGDVNVIDRDLDNPPTSEAELRGVIVVVRRIDTGVVICTGWVPKKIIDIRRDGSDAYKYAESEKGKWSRDSDPWHKWYVEQAMKTAMHYAINRGWCVVDDTEAVRALKADQESDFDYQTIDVDVDQPTEEPQTKTQKLESKLEALNPVPSKSEVVEVKK